jgi:glycosyltransferase involved in cell wall biosynthesis
MKVAYLINQYPQPSQSFIRREIAALEQLGLTVDRYTVRRWDRQLIDPRDQEEAKKTRCILDAGAMGLILACLRMLACRPARFVRAAALAWRCGRRSERGLLLHGVYLAEACVLARWLAECGTSHVHAHFGTNSTTVAMLAHALGGPGYSFTCHGPEEFDKPQFVALGEKIARCRFAVAISEFGRSQMYRWCRYEDWGKIQIVRCGVDPQFLDAPPTPMPADPKLVCVGRLSEQKGQLLLIEAAAQLAGRGMRFELVLVGDGEMRPQIESLIQRHHLADHVRLAGWMSGQQVRDEILSGRALVLPSFAEGLPVVIMEALALGRPVLSTYVAGIPELVEGDINGWLVPAGSVQRLGATMEEILRTSPSRLEEMGKAGAAKVREKHNAATEAARLAELFEPMDKTDT